MATRKFRMVSAEESGIGGFLLFFAFTQVISLGIVVWHIPGTITETFGPDAGIVSQMDPAYVPLVSGELFFQIVRGVAFIIGLVLIFRRDPRAPKFYQYLLGGIVVLAVLDMFFASRSSHAIDAWLTAHGKATAGVDAAFSKGQIDNLRAIGYSLIWFMYWRSSERVRLTFTEPAGMTEIPKTS